MAEGTGTGPGYADRTTWTTQLVLAGTADGAESRGVLRAVAIERDAAGRTLDVCDSRHVAWSARARR